MKKERIVLLIIVLLVILTFGICTLIVILNNTEEEHDLVPNEPSVNIEIQRDLKHETDKNSYYVAKSCVEKFYEYYSEIFDEEYEGYLINSQEDKDKVKLKRTEKIYMMLDKEYIEYEGITLENLTSKLGKKENISILIKNIYSVQKDETISIYFVQGTTNEVLSSKVSDFNIMLKIDFKNRTFKLLLGEKVKKYYSDLQNQKEIEIEEQISNDTYNTFRYEHITEKDYINDLFMHYKKSVRFSKEDSYNLLDENYKKICFENSNDYLLYLDSNYSKIVSARLDEYNKEEKTNWTEYLFKDKKGNYYIFKETAPFKYTVQLDNYTIPTQEFKQQYNGSSDKQKTAFNIKQFFKGIDDKNYGYSYNVLSESFKNNKYPTKGEFVNYVKQNFFDKNEIEYINWKKENNLYIYEIKITDATGKSSEEKKFNMIVKLNSGTNFEISFGTN